MKKVLLSLLVLTLLSPVLVFGAGLSDTPTDVSKLKLKNGVGIQNILDGINEVANWMLVFLIALAVIMIIWAAFIYLFSKGDEKNTGKAKNYIIYALVAIAVGLLAKGLVTVVMVFVGTF